MAVNYLISVSQASECVRGLNLPEQEVTTVTFPPTTGVYIFHILRLRAGKPGYITLAANLQSWFEHGLKAYRVRM